jgi:hypothetical protein
MIKLPVKILKIGDVEDPDIYLGAAWYDFEKTEQGQWLKNHARELVYQQSLESWYMGYIYTVYGVLDDEDAVYYKLKWPGLE